MTRLNLLRLNTREGIGIVAVTGVVANDSLVSVSYVNETRAAGTPPLQAVREAGAARIRPILLTSLTTFAGLTPSMIERSVQAQFLIPISLAWRHLRHCDLAGHRSVDLRHPRGPGRERAELGEQVEQHAARAAK